IGEPDTPVRMHHEILGSIEPAALIAVGDDADPAIGFIAQHAASAVLGGQLPALKVEGVAVAVAGRFTEVRDAAVVLYPAQLPVTGDVAPDQVAAHPVPGRPFRPQGAA